MIRERALAGLAGAKTQGTKLGTRRIEEANPRGPRPFVRRARRAKNPPDCSHLGVGAGTVLRVTGAPAWEPAGTLMERSWHGRY